ncbi:hypothetical protein IFO68_04480 [Photobacterium sp. CAU 1568]|uniref:JmjC domain-containing protein n=2 Tax=Vibrionaceae TaxID=641 RepID=A0ABR9BKF1_9GAMM|nr:hypothetical protein [Photobacterium arenosum]
MINTSSLLHVYPGFINDLIQHVERFDSLGSSNGGEVYGSLMEPLLLKEAFDVESLSEDVIFTLLTSLKEDSRQNGSSKFRLYIEGKENQAEEKRFIGEEREASESIEQFFMRVSEGKKFGIVINGVQQWSDDISRFAAKVFKPLVERYGYSCASVEATLFMGNYGYTPFGIHVDDPYTHVVHFHLGPAAKSMTLFEPELFHQLNGPEKNCYQPEDLISYGDTYEISAGSMFLLPANYYHVGNTQSFSIGLALSISKNPESAITQFLLYDAVNDNRFAGDVHEVIERLEISQITLAEWMSERLEDHCLRNKSQKGLRYSFIEREVPEFENNTVFLLDPDFSIEFADNGEKIRVFCRGNKIKLSSENQFIGFLQCLTSQKDTFTIRKLYEYFNGEVNMDTITFLIALFYSFGVIHIRE